MIGTTKHTSRDPSLGFFTDDELYTFLRPTSVRTPRQFLSYFIEHIDPYKSKIPESREQIERVLTRLINTPS